MDFILTLLWDHHLGVMAGAYACLFLAVLAIVRTLWTSRRDTRAEAIAFSLMVALVPWLGVKIAVHEHLGGHAIAIAERMPAEHPQLGAFQQARAAFDVGALNQWANINRDPVSAGVIAKTQAALDKLPPSPFKSQLQQELATGYLSAARFEAAALSIIQISVKELGLDPALLELARYTPNVLPELLEAQPPAADAP